MSFQFQGSVILSQKDSETQEEKKIQKIATGGFLCQLQVKMNCLKTFTLYLLKNNYECPLSSKCSTNFRH